MGDWNAGEYLRFASERTRPAADLLARVALDAAREVIDLGCGPGNGTALLAARFPSAHLIGVDSAPDMLARARSHLPGVAFVQADLRDYAPPAPPDLIFANAVLQWLPDHASLLPRLVRQLRPDGCLAFQVPDNLDEPSHALMRETAAHGPWQEVIAAAGTGRERLPSPEQTYDWLCAAGCADIDIWTTTYRHPLADAGAIAAWLQSTGLRPYLAPLAPAMRADFLRAYEARLARAYPRQADGRVLLRFPRRFVVARRAA